MNNQKRSVALLGAGYISDYHALAVQKLPELQLKAICDLNQGRAERVARLVGGPPVYTDLATMLARESIDAVHVLTPPNAHFGPTRQLLEAGKHVLVEKPLATSSSECSALAELAASKNLTLGVSHNFLFFPVYERLVSDVESGRLGKLDQIDIVWNKELGQLRGGPFGGWLFADPKNILFEVAPHSFAHVAHLIGMPDKLQVQAEDPLALPGGRVFYRRWEVLAWKGTVSLRLRFSFIEGYPEHYIHVRGTHASGTVDFEKNTYVRQEHAHDLLDLDRFFTVCNAATSGAVQAGSTLLKFVLGKAGLPLEGSPFPESIQRAVASFYGSLDGAPDRRLAARTAGDAVQLAEQVARAVQLPSASRPSTSNGASNGAAKPIPPAPAKPNVLVLGGTGFIGRALVKKLREAGHGVRVLARDPLTYGDFFASVGAEVQRGDVENHASLAEALQGITHVYHLARGYGKTVQDYLAADVEPTRHIAEECLRRGLWLYYTSSIAIYNAGNASEVITEDTPPHEGAIRVNPYVRAKVESEKLLVEMYKQRGLKVVIFRPGIVIGSGGSPYHWGVGGWPYKSVCRLWGDGTNRLPIVLVDDCAEAMVRAMDTPGIEGESFNLVGEPCLSAQEYLNELERHAKVKIRRLPTPAWKYFIEDAAKFGLKTVGRDPTRRLPSYSDYVSRSARAYFSPEKAKTRLGWRPASDVRVVVEQGIHVPVDEFLA